MLAAASLTRALADLERGVEQRHPELDVRLEIGGSQEVCRKVSELNRRADLVVTADLGVIEKILMPGHASWAVAFATNEVLLAHMEHSHRTGEITADNWPEVLLGPGVRLGMVNPDLAPMGYRTLLVWELAERSMARGRPGLRGLARRLRAAVPAAEVVPHEAELMQRLQARAIDYAFVYRSTAEEHNLKVVALPDAYNLGSDREAGAYAQVAVSVRMDSGEAPRRVKGAPVIYGATIPLDAPNPAGAELVLGALLGEEGRRSLRRTGFSPLPRPRCQQPGRLPAAIRPLMGGD